MSSDDDDVMLLRRKGKPDSGMAPSRPAVALEARNGAQARQSKEAVPQKLLQRTLSSAQRGKQHNNISSNAASAEQDSDDDAQLLRRHQVKLQQQSKVRLWKDTPCAMR